MWRCKVEDLGYEGCQYMWSNAREQDDYVECRLDRAVVSEDWRCIFPYYKVKHLPRYKLDHNPIIVEAEKMMDALSKVTKKKMI